METMQRFKSMFFLIGSPVILTVAALRLETVSTSAIYVLVSYITSPVKQR